MALKDLTKKIPFWEISLVTLFFLTGYGVSFYNQSNSVSANDVKKNRASAHVNDLSELDLDAFMKSLEDDSDWMQEIKYPSSSSTSNKLTHSTKQRSNKSYAYSKTRPTGIKKKKNSVDKLIEEVEALSLNEVPQTIQEPLFEAAAPPSEDRETKELLESLYCDTSCFDSRDNSNLDAPLPASEPTLKKKSAKLKRKKNKNSKDQALAKAEKENKRKPMLDGLEEDSFAIAMNDSDQPAALQNSDQSNGGWIYEGGYDSSDWITRAVQAQTDGEAQASKPVISDFIGQSTSIESSIKAFSAEGNSDDQGYTNDQEYVEGNELKGRAFDEEDYQYLTNQNFTDPEVYVQAPVQAADMGFEVTFDENFNPNEFQAPEYVLDEQEQVPVICVKPLRRPSPRRPVAYVPRGARRMLPPPPPGMRRPYPARQVRYRLVPPPQPS